MAVGRYVAQRAGIGINAGRIRGINSRIRGGEVQHTGVIPFLKKFEATVRCCTQNGVRGGSATVHFPIWHQEIEDILVLKNNKGTEDNRVRKLDYSIQITKLFYERFIKNEDITLFSPNNVPGLYEAFGMPGFDELYKKYEADKSIPKSTIGAQELFMNMLKERAETGRIYIMNLDHCNTHSSFKDKIYMSNLCVSGDTSISILSDKIGVKDIEIKDLETYLKEDDTIKVYSKNLKTNETEFNKVLDFGKTSDSAEVLKITDEDTNKSIILTPEHRVYTKNRGYIMAKELKENDKLVIE